jgi:glycine betaine catabolism B
MFKTKYLGKVQETPTDWSFRFERPEGYEYKAGQYSVIRIELSHPDTRSNARTCSFSSSPTEQYLQFTFTIRDTGFKHTLMEMKEGTIVELTPARGKMIMDSVLTSELIMIAGGVGVTPFRGIIKEAYDSQLSEKKIVLLYSDKTIEELAFYAEFQKIEMEYANLSIIYTLTRHEPHHGEWLQNQGRIDSLFIERSIENVDNSTFMICGPVEMAQNALSHLQNFNIPRERIITELFTGY